MRPSGTIEVEVRHDDVLITMRGDVDLLVTTEFDMVAELGEAQGLPVRIDLAGVTFLDSCGIAQLLTARNLAPEVHLVQPPPEVSKLLALSGVTRLFSFD